MTLASHADALRALYQDWSARLAANPDYSIPDLRSIFDEWHQVTREPEGVGYREETLGGVPAIWTLPAGADDSKVVLYTHGGGFAVGSAASHRKLAGHLAKALGVTAVVIDYRRSPEHPFPAQIEDAVAVYQALLAQGIQATNITTAGDSAGGNLAISTVLKLRDLSLPLPGAVIAFSPWLDMEHVGQTLVSNDATDALVHKPLLEGMSGMFLGETGSRTDPLANPLKADFHGFPRLYVNAGSVETLLDNALDVAELARSAGVDVELSVAAGMQHVFPFLAGRASEADDELKRIGRWYHRQH
jgi:epsilon-lactone hydrolase